MDSKVFKEREIVILQIIFKYSGTYFFTPQFKDICVSFKHGVQIQIYKDFAAYLCDDFAFNCDKQMSTEKTYEHTPWLPLYGAKHSLRQYHAAPSIFLSILLHDEKVVFSDQRKCCEQFLPTIKRTLHGCYTRS